MCAPSTRWLAVSTTSVIKVFSGRPESVWRMGLKRDSYTSISPYWANAASSPKPTVPIGGWLNTADATWPSCAALRQRHRGQGDALGHIAHGVDVVHRGLAKIVHLHTAARGCAQARCRQVQAFGLRRAAGGVHHGIEVLCARHSTMQLHRELAVGQARQ